MSRTLGFVLYVVALIVALAYNDVVHSQTLQWTQLDEKCAGEPLLRTTGKTNPACRQRDSISSALIKQGWLPCNHGVWLSPEQQKWFVAVLRDIDAKASTNIAQSYDMMPMLLHELRQKLSDAQIFAIWNEQRPALQAYAPYGSMVMTSMMQKLAMVYARSHDPRYILEP